MTGYAAGEVRDSNCQFLTGPETDAEKVATVKQAIDNRESVTVELRTNRADDSAFWNRLTVTPITDESDQLVSYLGTHRDITVKKRRSDELISERRLMTQAINTLEEIFYVLDTDGKLLRWNQRLPEETGYTAAELDAMHAVELFPERERATVAEAIQKVLAGEETSIEVDMLAADGKQLPFELTGSRLLDADGNPMGLVGVGRKIIERNERRQHLKLLERVLRHNVRNRINVIQGRAEIVRDKSASDMEQSARTIIDASTQLINIMEKERELVEILRNPPEPACLDVRSALSSAVSTVTSACPTVEVTIDSPDGIGIAVDQQFHRALREVIENAVVHNDADAPVVSIAVSQCSDGIDVEISDNGPEIPPIERDVLTEDTTKTPLYHGSGLGLSLVRLLTRRSGGRIDYEQNTPSGNRITLTLPESTDSVD
jgi:PAS domain S-box-containing protein